MGKTSTSGKFFDKMIETSRARRKPDDEVFVMDSTYPRHRLKQRLIEQNIMEYKCVECGNTGTHNGKPLVLHLDHINGNCVDNRLENLRFLCPNCHAQSNTYCIGHKRLKKNMPS